MGVVGGMDMNKNEIWTWQIDNNQTLYCCYGNNGKESWVGEKVWETWIIIVFVHTYIRICEKRSCLTTFPFVYVQIKVFIFSITRCISTHVYVFMCLLIRYAKYM